MKLIRKKIKTFLKDVRGFYFRYLGYIPVNYFGHNLKLNFEQFEFWEKASKGQWEPETFNILSKFLTPDSIYLDIGAWIGPTVIYASKRCKQVICFEPDPVAYRNLLSNIHLNNLTNINTFNLALSSETSIQTISNFGGNPGNSMTTLLNNDKSTLTPFDVLVLDWGFVEAKFSIQHVSMIKIDIEGGEFSLILEMEAFLKRKKPVLFLSIHAPLLDEDVREKEVNSLISVLGNCYSTCLNANFENVNINELTNEGIMDGFCEFLFK